MGGARPPPPFFIEEPGVTLVCLLGVVVSQVTVSCLSCLPCLCVAGVPCSFSCAVFLNTCNGPGLLSLSRSLRRVCVAGVWGGVVSSVGSSVYESADITECRSLSTVTLCCLLPLPVLIYPVPIFSCGSCSRSNLLVLATFQIPVRPWFIVEHR